MFTKYQNISIYLFWELNFSFPFTFSSASDNATCKVLQVLPVHLTALPQTSLPPALVSCPPQARFTSMQPRPTSHPIPSLDVCKKGRVFSCARTVKTLRFWFEKGRESIIPCSRFTAKVSVTSRAWHWCLTGLCKMRDSTTRQESQTWPKPFRA